MESIDTQFWHEEYKRLSIKTRKDVDDAFESALRIFKARGYDNSRLFLDGARELTAALTHYVKGGIPSPAAQTSDYDEVSNG